MPLCEDHTEGSSWVLEVGGGRDLPLQWEANGRIGGGKILLPTSGVNFLTTDRFDLADSSCKWSSSTMLSKSGSMNFKSSTWGSSAKKDPCWELIEDSCFDNALVEKLPSSEQPSV